MVVDGNWNLTIDSLMGQQHVLAELAEEDGELVGKITNINNDMTSEIFDGVVDGSELRWKVKLQQFKMTLAFSTTVDDNVMSGKVKAGMFGSFKVAGERVTEQTGSGD